MRFRSCALLWNRIPEETVRAIRSALSLIHISYRMEKARQMLDGTREKIGTVAEKAGYPNVSYFCQSFREYYGVSPQRYREKKDGAGRYGTDQAMD